MLYFEMVGFCHHFNDDDDGGDDYVDDDDDAADNGCQVYSHNDKVPP